MSRWGPAALASGVDLEGLKATLQVGARLLNLPQESLTVLTLTGDEHLREYNRRWKSARRAKAWSATFAISAPPGTESWLGDIVISLPRARRQAKDAGHPIDDEVRLLAVHGLLHLLGYDHAEAEEETKMTQLTNRILEAAG